METRAKTMQWLILSSDANWESSEYCNEKEIDHIEKSMH